MAEKAIYGRQIDLPAPGQDHMCFYLAQRYGGPRPFCFDWDVFVHGGKASPLSEGYANSNYWVPSNIKPGLSTKFGIEQN